ncbi:MAG: alpha/beta hydrolase [Opitutales bacterium]
MKAFLSQILVLLGILLLAYAGFVLLVAFFQRSLIYYPSTAEREELEASAQRQGLVPWMSAAGDIMGWNLESTELQRDAENRLIIFHGNAGFALHREYFIDLFHSLDGGSLWDVYIFEYPGYGPRDGRPSKNAFVEAAHAAYRELLSADDRPVYLLGESIGCGVATAVAAREAETVAGVLMISPFTRLSDVGAGHFPFLPVRLLLRDEYDNTENLRRYGGRAAFVVAGRDEVIPARLGRQLYEEYAGPKKLWIQEEATHNTIRYTPADPMWQEISDFLISGR